MYSFLYKPLKYRLSIFLYFLIAFPVFSSIYIVLFACRQSCVRIRTPFCKNKNTNCHNNLINSYLLLMAHLLANYF